MKIDINKDLVPVSSLEYGDVFVSKGIVYMRGISDSGHVVSICLSNGHVNVCSLSGDNEKVKKINAKLVLDR